MVDGEDRSVRSERLVPEQETEQEPEVVRYLGISVPGKLLFGIVETTTVPQREVSVHEIMTSISLHNISTYRSYQAYQDYVRVQLMCAMTL